MRGITHGRAKNPELKLPEIKMPDPAEMAKLFSHVAEKSQVIVKEFLNRQKDRWRA
jgi:polyhydroxyalkanoate synthase